MDNHPIPQDVTGFQFKLIGNMTVKQFAYLATGLVFAGVFWQLPINILVKFPLCAFFAILGLGLAFFPVSGRPMDLMIGNYIKALIRPTQFVYEKIGGQIYFPNKTPVAAARIVRQYKNDLSILPKDKLKVYLESLNARPKNRVDEKENSFLASVSNLAANNNLYPPNSSAPSLNVQQVSFQPNPVIQKSQQKTLSDPPSIKTTPLEQSEKVPPLPDVTAQTISPVTPPVKPESPQRINLSGQVKKTNFTPSVPDSPNLITGITRDPRGNALSNILVEVKDKDGNPVRAFKTNEVGRFASATPLINGSYTIEFEDPKAQNKFEKIVINAAGQIILPIEAVSVDTREELRRSLFARN